MIKSMEIYRSKTKIASRLICLAICVTLAIMLVLPFMATDSGFAVHAADEQTDAASSESNAVQPISADPIKSLSPLNLVKSIPKENDKNVPVDTVGIKLYFDGDVTSESVRDINSKCFTFANAKKKETIETTAYFDKRDSGYILVIAQKKDKKGAEVSLTQDSEYTLTISGGLMAADGRVIGEDQVIHFRTLDASGNTRVYMLLMVGMIVAMIAISFISKRRKAKAEAEASGVKPVNPYKMAREKGITVQEALVLIEKEKQKREKRLKAAGVDPKSIKEQEIEKPDTHKVKGPRPITAAGSTYKTGRKAEAEKKAREEEERKAKGTTNPKNKNKGKGKKKKKK